MCVRERGGVGCVLTSNTPGECVVCRGDGVGWLEGSARSVRHLVCYVDLLFTHTNEEARTVNLIEREKN